MTNRGKNIADSLEFLYTSLRNASDVDTKIGLHYALLQHGFHVSEDMGKKPEDIAREQIDRMLELSGWAVQDAKAVNLYAKQGVAIREFELKSCRNYLNLYTK